MSLTPEQIIQRRTGISGTDAAAIVGMSQWRTAADVWLEKKHPNAVTDPTEKKKNEWDWAHKKERAIADHYAQVNRVTLLTSTTVSHPSVPWLLATPDRLVKGAKRGLELKTVIEWHRSLWGPAGTDLVPHDYLIQVQHYMMVFGYKEWDIAAEIGGQIPRIYRIYADRELQHMLYNAEKKFYTNYILGDAEPKFDHSEQLRAYVLKKYPKHTVGKSIAVDIYGDAKVKDSIKALLVARAKKKSGSRDEETEKTFIMNFMQDAEELNYEEIGVAIKWKAPKDSLKIDWEAIAKGALEKTTLQPEEISALKVSHTKVKPNTRRFTVKDKNATEKDLEDDE